MAFCESENLSLRHRVKELEKPLKITSDQNCITKSSNRKNSNETISIQTIDICTQVINLSQFSFSFYITTCKVCI